MQRQHREQEVHAQIAVEALGLERRQVDLRGPHLVPVRAHQPRSTRVGVPHDPRVRGAVAALRQPTLAARLLRARLVAALEEQVFVLEAPHTLAADSGVLESGRRFVKAGRLLEPAAIPKERARSVHLAGQLLNPRAPRHRHRQRHRREERLVDPDFGSEAERGIRNRNILVVGLLRHARDAGRQERRHGERFEQQPETRAADPKHGQRERDAEQASERGILRNAQVPGVEQHRDAGRQQQATRDHRKQESHHAEARRAGEPAEAGDDRDPGQTRPAGRFEHVEKVATGVRPAGAEPGASEPSGARHWGRLGA
ncbi:MAG: hypothetical protein OEP95_03665 [Myxococcales bacterium]|nr:hypothetical protein [Myxococcales bacterium]